MQRYQNCCPTQSQLATATLVKYEISGPVLCVSINEPAPSLQEHIPSCSTGLPKVNTPTCFHAETQWKYVMWIFILNETYFTHTTFSHGSSTSSLEEKFKLQTVQNQNKIQPGTAEKRKCWTCPDPLGLRISSGFNVTQSNSKCWWKESVLCLCRPIFCRFSAEYTQLFSLFRDKPTSRHCIGDVLQRRE